MLFKVTVAFFSKRPETLSFSFNFPEITDFINRNIHRYCGNGGFKYRELRKVSKSYQQLC